MTDDILLKHIDYQFKQAQLLKLALTHRSKGEENNERLEFLGDAIVNFVVAEILFHQFPTGSEGELSRWRATLVNRDTLAALAKDLNLGPHLLLGTGEQRSGGNERLSILSCTMEAIIGAIYLDGGFAVVRDKIIAWYQPWVQSLSSAANHKDPKTQLQEYLQSRRLALPIYKVDNTEGEAHQQLFIVSCQVEGMEKKTIGKGTSRRRAEQEAAMHMLGELRK